MDLISYQTFVRRTGLRRIISDGYRFCGEDHGYGMFKSVHPKDKAMLIIDTVFTEEEQKNMAFAYVPYYYRGHNSIMDRIDVYCKKF